MTVQLFPLGDKTVFFLPSTCYTECAFTSNKPISWQSHVNMLSAVVVLLNTFTACLVPHLKKTEKKMLYTLSIKG